ncbi:MAG: hypothetical protein KGL46_06740 [Hyphomicrobiales bacterium]|nr:hypothetical protein [Hyphomicrobiales bacterium]
MTSRFRAVWAVALLAVFAGSARAEGIFDFLFGRNPQPQQQVIVPRPNAENRRVAAPRQAGSKSNHEAAARRAHAAEEARSAERARLSAFAAAGGVSGKQEALRPAPGTPVGAIGHFAADATLRSGDIVVTPKGFMVYRGGHDVTAFAPINAARQGKAIAALERASRGPAPSHNWSTQALAISHETNIVKSVVADAPKKGATPVSLR